MFLDVLRLFEFSPTTNFTRHMSYLLAIFALLAIGLVLPLCAVAFAVWMFGDTWNWRHLALSIPIILFCINAPAYSAAATGLLTWNSALTMHVFAIVLFGIATAVNGGNPTEGYILSLLILTISVTFSVVRRDWRGDDNVQDATVTEAEENHAIHPSGEIGRFGNGPLLVATG